METSKLTLTQNDYLSENTPEEIAEGVDFGTIPVVLTPFKSKTNEIEYSLDLFSKNKKNLLRLTPTDFLKSNLENKILIGEDLNLMKEFGYEDSIYKIKKKGINLIGTSYLDNPIPLSLNKFFVDCKGELLYVSLFVLSKVYKKVDIVTKEKGKVEIFTKVMQMDCKVFGVNDTLRGGIGDIVVVIDTPIELPSTKVIYVGSNYPTGCKEIKMDYKKVSKYVYRIRDLLKSITKDVLRGKREFNYARFKNILK